MNPEHPSEHNRSTISGRHDEMSWIIYGPVTVNGLKELCDHAKLLLQDVQIEHDQQKKLIQLINSKQEDVFHVLGSIIYAWFTETFERIDGYTARIDVHDINAAFGKSEQYILFQNVAKLQSVSARVRMNPLKMVFRECIRKHDILKLHLVQKKSQHGGCNDEFIIGWVFNLRNYFR